MMAKRESQIWVSLFHIDWESDKDGPGHRVVLYLQGCHLNCPWCHSPHSTPKHPPLLFFETLCRFCGACDNACPRRAHIVGRDSHRFEKNNCTGCGACLEACPTSFRRSLGNRGPLRILGDRMSIPELFRRLLPQLDLWRDTGGITISGGEPLLQHRQVAELLKLCRAEGIHTAVETSASLPVERILDIDDQVDCWLFGLRPTIPKKAVKGQDIGLVLSNLAALVGRNRKKIILRTPIVPGFTDDPEQLELIAGQMTQLNLHTIELLPFNPESRHYYRAMGREFPLQGLRPPSAERMAEIKRQFDRAGHTARVIR